MRPMGLLITEVGVADWTCEEVEDMLERFGYGDNLISLFRKEKLDGKQFLALTDEGLYFFFCLTKCYLNTFTDFKHYAEKIKNLKIDEKSRAIAKEQLIDLQKKTLLIQHHCKMVETTQTL